MQKPLLDSYKLTETDVQQLSVVRKETEILSSRIFNWSIGLTFLCVTVYEIRSTGSWLVGIWIGVCGLVIGVYLGVILSKIWEWINKAAHPKWMQYEKYVKDVRNYEAYLNEQRRIQEMDDRRKRLEHWTSCNGIEFEHEVAELFRRLGHFVVKTGGAGDEGIDLVVDNDTIVQCKQHAKPISPAVARELLGAMNFAKAKKAILICPSGFSNDTKEFARKANLELWDGDKLIAMAELIDGTQKRVAMKTEQLDLLFPFNPSHDP
ncbi:MAG TPA: hypothetical protein DCQ83_02020 [Fibrobacteres bacterium]|nr:hypothetical protein [Fibrobacterota bacterium]